MAMRGIATHAGSQMATLKDDICQHLQSLQQVPPSYAGDARHLIQIAEAKRLAALLHLEERVPVSSSHSMNKAQVIGLIDSIVDVLRSIPTTSAATLWPLFIVGSSTMATSDQRIFVLNRLKQLEDSRKLGSIHHARRLIERKMSTSSTFWPLSGQSQIELHLPTENEKWISLA